MKDDIQRGFAKYPVMQTSIRDRIGTRRIPDALVDTEEQLCHQAAEYIYELEEILMSHGWPKKVERPYTSECVKTYRFGGLITRDCTESAFIQVLAEDVEQATDMIWDMAHQNVDIRWEPNGACSDPYWGDPENDVERVVCASTKSD